MFRGFVTRAYASDAITRQTWPTAATRYFLTATTTVPAISHNPRVARSGPRRLRNRRGYNVHGRNLPSSYFPALYFELDRAPLDERPCNIILRGGEALAK